MKLILLALLLSACSITVEKSSPPVLSEAEPNDDAFTATYFGSLVPGSHLDIRGHITDDGPDVLDGFSFTTGAPCTVRCTLLADDPNADLDVCFFDPDQGEFVACFDDDSFEPEIGLVTILETGKAFHVVVESAFGWTDYTLRIETLPVLEAVPASAEETRAGGDARHVRTLERVSGYRTPTVDGEAVAPIERAGWIQAFDERGEPVEIRRFIMTRGRVLLGAQVAHEATAPTAR